MLTKQNDLTSESVMYRYLEIIHMDTKLFTCISGHLPVFQGQGVFAIGLQMYLAENWKIPWKCVL